MRCMRIAYLLPVSVLLLGPSCTHSIIDPHSTINANTYNKAVPSRHSFQIKHSDDPLKYEYWIIAGEKDRVRLPKLPHAENTTCPGPVFDISPDEEWIVADEKLWHGANELWLLHRDTPLHYSLVFPSFSR